MGGITCSLCEKGFTGILINVASVRLGLAGFVGSSSCLIGLVLVFQQGPIAALLCLFISKPNIGISTHIAQSLPATLFHLSSVSPRLPRRYKPKNLVSY